MDTEVLSVNDPEALRKAGRLLAEGGLVAIPTETVYGLACSAFCPDAVHRVYAAKGRPSDNPLIVHISDLSQLSRLAAEIPGEALALAEAYWPGPMTLIFPKCPEVPDEVTGGLSTVAVRFPKHPGARAVIDAAGVPLAAPSANLSGSPSPTCAAHVLEDLSGRIPLILDGGNCGCGVESTVVDLCRRPPTVLRPGSVSLEMLRRICPDTRVDPMVMRPVAADEKVRSPGMKYRHYAPKCPVIAVTGRGEASAEYIKDHLTGDTAVLCFEEYLRTFARVPSVAYGNENDPDSQARGLFGGLRLLDRGGYGQIYAQCPPLTEEYLAVTNRLCRAAAFHIIDADLKRQE